MNLRTPIIDFPRPGYRNDALPRREGSWVWVFIFGFGFIILGLAVKGAIDVIAPLL